MFTVDHTWVFAVGLLGNVISFMVFLAPLPTFIRIYKKKTTEGFQSLPYVAAIFSCMLWSYYALVKGNDVLLITINAIGVIIETIYIVLYLTYAPKEARMFTVKLLSFFNLGAFSAIVLFSHFLIKSVDTRLQVLGWICVTFSISVFAAPLSVIRTVIRTKSVEFMPFSLSFCLCLTATIWFFYGLLQKDMYITLPNVVGFVFGSAQMVIYAIYRKYDVEAHKHKIPEKVSNIDSLSKNEDINMPRQQTDDVVIELGLRAQENISNGPQLAQPCRVDADKTIAGGPTPATAAQLPEYAV